MAGPGVSSPGRSGASAVSISDLWRFGHNASRCTGWCGGGGDGQGQGRERPGPGRGAGPQGRGCGCAGAAPSGLSASLSRLQMFVGLLFWFQFYCGFSASAMIDQWYLIFFNLLFSSLPQLVTGVLDKDVPADVLLTEPQFYKSGQNMEVSLPAPPSPLPRPPTR